MSLAQRTIRVRILHSMVVHLSFTFTINPTKCFRVIGLRLQLTAIGVNIFFSRKNSGMESGAVCLKIQL